MSIADELLILNTTKVDIKAAIEAKGVTVGAVPFTDYAAKIADISSGPPTPPAPEAWVRPSDWLTLPTVTSTDQKFVGLLAIHDSDSNFVALNASGPYTVDWGDGVVENFNSAVVAQHTYNYSSISETTLCSRGYKQVIVTITPQSSQILTALDLQRQHTNHSATARYVGCLDITVSLPNASTNDALRITYSDFATVLFTDLEQVKIMSYVSSVHRNLFNNAIALRSVVLMNTASTVTDLTSMFQNCRSLTILPELNTSTATNMSSMFSGCRSLTTIPELNTGNVTNMSGMFNGCNSLITIPLLNTAAVNNMSSMFNGCFSLTTVPLLNTAAVTTMQNMFLDCRSLTSVPLFNTVLVNTMSNMFNTCSNLSSVPLFNTAAVTTMSNMFTGCTNLTTIPQFSSGSVTTMSSMFSGCTSLVEVNLTSTASVTTTTSMFASCPSLRRIKTTSGFTQTFTITTCNLGPTALNELYTSLATVTAKTITVSGNWGVATDDPSIATAKGWTVTG
jgi:surface protein